MPTITLTENDDTFTADQSPGNDSIYGHGGDDQIDAGSGSDSVFGEYGADTLHGGDGDDRVYSNDVPEYGNYGGRLISDGSSDMIFGGDGRDFLFTDSRGDTAYGGEGDDNLSGPGTLIGGQGNDFYTTRNGAGSFATVFELPDEGIDWVSAYAHVGETLIIPDNVENAFLYGRDYNATTVIIGNDLANVVSAGYATVYGMDGDDTLSSSAALYGGDGNDALRPGSNAYVDGGSGTDTVFIYAGRGSRILEIDMANSLWINVENLTITTARNYLVVHGTDGGNVINGPRLGRVYANGGDDQILVQDFRSNLPGGSSKGFFDGGDGYDTLEFGPSTSYSTGVSFNMVHNRVNHGTVSIERVIGTDFADTFIGNTEDNLIEGRKGDDTISGGLGSDTLYGNDGNDTLNGDAGDDVLYGGNSDDHLFGGAGHDRLIGNAGADDMHGGAGNDIYVVSDAAMTVVELADEGRDTVRTSVNWTLSDNVEDLISTGSGLSLSGNIGDNLIVGDDGDNVIDGVAGNDVLWGGLGNDDIKGSRGNDTLRGNGGDDTLDGGIGNDILIGDEGRDVLTGGSETDKFYFKALSDTGNTRSSADVIVDFSSAELDLIVLGNIDADSTQAGDQAFTFIGGSDFTGAAGQLCFTRFSGDTFVRGDVDGDSVADFMIRLTGIHTLTAADFVL